jgi:hypothetical protein
LAIETPFTWHQPDWSTQPQWECIVMNAEMMRDTLLLAGRGWAHMLPAAFSACLRMPTSKSIHTREKKGYDYVLTWFNLTVSATLQGAGYMLVVVTTLILFVAWP